MAASFGTNYRITIFGESHGTGVGVVIDGLPSGLEIDFCNVIEQMNRRKPGANKLTTPRKENDEFEILSGLYNGMTTGAPLTAFIKSSNKKSRDYSKFTKIPRPSHADYPAHVKYKGYNDFRGGGVFSGRLTAPIVFAGAIAKQILSKNKITIGGHILCVGDIKDTPFNLLGESEEKLNELTKSAFPICDENIKNRIVGRVESLKSQGDSIGGVVECMAIGLPLGVGEPFFNSLESVVSHLAFSVPGVKGIEFGSGFNFANYQGSEANDCWRYDNNKIVTKTNHNGGVVGGMSTGMPIVYRAVFKPTSSIAIKQPSINLHTKQNVELKIEGRHDPCIVMRAVPVMEAVLAIALMDLIDSDIFC